MIKFIKEKDIENDHDVSIIEFKVDSGNLDEILEEFEYFLRGCGYGFKGHVAITEDEDLIA